MKRKDKDAAYYYLIFLIWPLMSLIPALFRFRDSIGRTIVILVVSFIGFTTVSEGDLDFYERKFYINKNTAIGDLVAAYTSLENSDIYSDLLSTFTGFVFTTHRPYFAILFGIFAYLLTGVLLNFLKLVPTKLSLRLLLAFLGFALYFSIRNVISVRFYTGGLYFLFMFTNYIISREKKYLWLTILTPLFHFGLGLTVLIAPLFLYLKNKVTIAIAIVMATFFIGQTAVVDTLESVASSKEETFIALKYKAYASESGQELFEEVYSNRFEEYNWKAKTLEVWWNYLFYGSNVLFFILFTAKSKFENNIILRETYVLLALLLATTNLMTNISNGDRYVGLFSFLFLGFSFLLYVKKTYKGLLHQALFFLNLSGLLYGLAAIYAANPLFTYKFFIFNYFVAAIWG